MRTLRGVFDRVLACTLAMAGCGGELAGQPEDGGAPAPSPTGGSFSPAVPPSASAAPPEPPANACTTVAPASPSAAPAFPVEPTDPFDTAPPDRWAISHFTCETDLLARVQPEVAVDYLSLRSAGAVCTSCIVGISEEHGEACSSATDHAACIARVMTEIAEDETRHAELSWAIARWADDRLDAPARERVARARRAGARALQASPGHPMSTEVHDVAGLPSPRDGGRMFAALAVELSLLA